LKLEEEEMDKGLPPVLRVMWRSLQHRFPLGNALALQDAEWLFCEPRRHERKLGDLLAAPCRFTVIS
jgi:hypothetical protein